MGVAAEAVLLRIFVGEDDRHRGRPLYQAIVDRAREAGLAGATVLPGPEGFGRSRYVRSELNIDAGSRLPMIVEIVDGEDRIDRFLPVVQEMVESGLVTLEKVRAIRYGRTGAGAEPETRTAAAAEVPSEDSAMDVPHDAVLLRIFTSVADRVGVEPLYQVIVKRAHDMQLAGATVLRGPLGFGHSAKLHQEHFLPLTQDSPIVIEIVDSEEKINAFLPVLDQLMESGLVTLEKARVLQYGRQRAGLLQRIRDQFQHHA